MSGPSENALAESMVRAQHTGSIREILDAAHDPALGLDRSVCLRDVVEKIRNDGEYACGGFEPDVAAWVSRMFGVGS